MSDPSVLHFFPGEKRLVFLVNGVVRADVEAWGGPAMPIAGDVMDQAPTHPGRFVIYSVGPYRTRTWQWSKILWGTRLVDNRDDVLFEESIGRWSSVFKKTGITRPEIITEYVRLYGVYRVPATWVFNDFGPFAIRYFKDVNKNQKLDGNEALSGEMFHTTPANEAEWAQGLPITMSESHGCIHLKPPDLGALRSSGAFAWGTTLVIHIDDERFAH